MPSSIELEISKLLHTSQKSETVANELIKRWRSGSLSSSEQLDCAQFLINSGLYPTVFKEFRRALDTGAILPWGQIAEALGRSGVKPKAEELSAIFEGAEAQGATGELVSSNQLDLVDRKFAQKRTEFRLKQKSQLEEKKQSLKEKLDFMRANRLIEEEAKLIKEIQSLFPGETDINAQAESFQVRWAKEVVSNSLNQSDHNSLANDLQWKADRLSPDQIAAKGLIFERARELAKSDQRLAYDLALSLHMMDFHEEALDVLNNSTSPAACWLRLELLIHARKFVTALEYASQIEVDFAHDPESSFAVVYTRARALHGLGQKEMAVDLLKSLLRIRPNYKSAHSLLLDWTGGEF